MLETVTEVSFFSPSAFQASLQTRTVQASNIGTGAAMSLIKKIDVPRHFAARRAMRQAAAQRACQQDVAGDSAIRPAGTKATAAKLAEDFSLGHSVSGPSASTNE
jgi:hypothetical protein